MPTRSVIDRFLGARRIAVVGVSRHSKSFANTVYRQLRSDRELVPINDAAQGEPIEGDRSYATLADVPGALDGALVMVPPHRLMDTLAAVADRGVGMVWIHRGMGQPPVPSAAVEFCRAHDIDVVDGACPLMFVEPVTGFHRVHRFCAGRRIVAQG